MNKRISPAIRGLLYALIGSSLFWHMPVIAYAAGEDAEKSDAEQQAAATETTDKQREFTLEGLEVTADRDRRTGLPPAYAGGKIARGSQMGLLGNKDFLDTPFTITSYTAELMEDQQAKNLTDVLTNDPSVRSNAYASYYGMWTIRGFPVLNEDVGFNGLYGIAPLYSSGTEFVERVEVLKGPGALLNGMSPTGGIGGSINLIPKRAGEEPLTRLTTSYSGDSQLGGHLDIGRRFGENKQFGVRFNGVYRNGDMRFDGESQKTSAATLALDYRQDRLRTSLDLGYQENDIDAPSTVMYLASGVSIPKVPKNTTNFDSPWAYVHSKDTFGVLHSEFDLDKQWTAFASAGMRRSRTEYLFSRGTINNALGDFSQYFYNYPSKTNSQTEELGLRGQFSTGTIRHQLVLSGTRLEADLYQNFRTVNGISSNIYDIVYGSPLEALKGTPKASKTTLSSIVLADTLSTPDDRLQLTLGARHQQVQVDNFSASSGAKTTSYDESAITPAVGLVVKVRPNLSFYSNYIEGLQQGPTAPSTAINAGEVFAPYKSKQYEAGIKIDAGTFATTLSAFQIKKPSGLTDPDTLIYSLNGEQRHRGLELNLFGEPVKGTRLMGGVMLLDAEMVRASNSTYNGNDPVGVPRWTATLGAEWDVPFQPGLTMTARAVYNGSQYLNSANTLKVSPWTRFDVGARYTFKQSGTPVTIRATVTNVLNKRHWTGTTGGALAIGAPRTLLLSATVDL